MTKKTLMREKRKEKRMKKTQRLISRRQCYKVLFCRQSHFLSVKSSKLKTSLMRVKASDSYIMLVTSERSKL